MDIKKRLLRTLVLALIGLGVGAGIAYMQIQQERYGTTRDAGPAPTMTGVQVGGDFTLTDHNGNPASASDWADKHKLIYFGFTYCPAICPTELQKISAVLNRAGEDANNIQPLFVSVDPERDTVEVMRDYLSLFHPAFVGLTGSVAEIETVKSQYRVFATKVDDPTMSEYTVDHSSFIYLMSPDDRLISMYRIQDNAEFILSDLRDKGVI